MMHGTSGAYTNHGCRCGECRAANAANMKRYRAERKANAERAKASMAASTTTK